MDRSIELFVEKRTKNTWSVWPLEFPRLPDIPTEALAEILFDLGEAYFVAEIESLGPGRGIPKDASAEVREALSFVSEDTFISETGWLHAHELCDYDYGAPVLQQAYVPKKHAGLFHRAKPFPKAFPKGEGIAGIGDAALARVEWTADVESLLTQPFMKFVGKLRRDAKKHELRVAFGMLNW